jgi:opacity protein-like surface antigen
MRGILRSAVAVGLLGILGATGVEAQARVILGVGGGTISPLSKSKWTVGSGTAVKSLGYNAQFMIGVAPAKGIFGVRLDGQYASLNHEVATAGNRPKDKLTGANLDLVLHAGQSGSAIRPYILAGPSVYHDSYRTGTTVGDSSNTKFGFNGGAGLNFGKSDRVWFFLEARYVYAKIFETSHSFVPVDFGVRISTHQAYSKGK